MTEIIDKGTPNWTVTKVTPKDDFTLELDFFDGSHKIFDVKTIYNRPIYQPLQNLALFKTAHLAGDTVVWNEDIDLSPEFLYNSAA